MGAFNDEIYTVATSYEGMHIPYGTGHGQIDCSHFVARILEQATRHKFPYIVANEYISSPHFQKVDHPQRGDIVFWHKTPHGHVAVVLEPHTGLFIGSQSTHGVGTDHFTSHYWRAHGSGPQFLRFVG
jgi:cell wall-associated NlpC family hydrolase